MKMDTTGIKYFYTKKILKGLTETIDYVKTDLMPDFDFDAFNHDTPYEGSENNDVSENITSPNNTAPEESVEKEPDTSATGIAPAATPEIDVKPNDEEVDKW